MLRKIFIAVIAIFSIANNAQTIFPSYYFNNDMEFATPGSMLWGLAGFNNPAELSFQTQPNIYFTWNDKDSEEKNFSSWGLFTSIPYLGFGIHNQSYKNYSITDYKLSTALGSDAFSVGLGYGWSTGDVKFLERSDLFTLGAIFRPANFISLNLMANVPSKGEREGIIGAGIRPLANYNLTFFGDYTFTDDKVKENIKWSAGAVIEPLDGLRLIGRYFDGNSFNVGVQLGFGSFGLTTNTHFNEDAEESYNTY